MFGLKDNWKLDDAIPAVRKLRLTKTVTPTGMYVDLLVTEDPLIEFLQIRARIHGLPGIAGPVQLVPSDLLDDDARTMIRRAWETRYCSDGDKAPTLVSVIVNDM